MTAAAAGKVWGCRPADLSGPEERRRAARLLATGASQAEVTGASQAEVAQRVVEGPLR